MRRWEGRVPVGEEGVITATTATIMEGIRVWLPVVSKEILVQRLLDRRGGLRRIRTGWRG